MFFPDTPNATLLTKIFIIIPWFHPAFKAGGPIQSIAGLVKHLASEELSFNIVCSNKDMDETVLDVPANVWVKYNDGTQVWYSADDNIVPVIKREMIKQQDAVLYIVGIYDWAYNIKPLLFLKGVKKIISVRGMFHPGALTQKPLKKKLFLFLMKLWGWQRKVVFHVTDEKERGFVKTQLRTCLPVGKVKNEELGIQVAGNFPNLFDALPMPVKEVGKLKLVSVGLISPMKNYLLVLNALESIGNGQLATHRGLQPGNKYIEYNIYGPIKDAGYWEECKTVIKNMPDNVCVKYHGAVEPAEVEKALAESHVFILPSKSENYGHSIIEALSAGRPVITSNATPWNGLQDKKAGLNVESGEVKVEPACPVGRVEDFETGGGLAEAISFFLNMPQEELDEWSKGAGAYVNKAIDMEEIKQEYRVLFGG